MHRAGRVATGVAAAVAVALASGAASAQEAASDAQGLDWMLRAGVGYSDNIGRNENGAISSATYSVGGALDYTRQQGRVDANVGINLDWVDYDAEGFDSQVWGNMNAALRYMLVPERLVWIVQNDFGQGSQDPFSSRSPDNVENLNYFTTGPELTLRFGDAMGAVLDARYSNVWFEDSPNASDRFEGGLNLFRDLSAASRAYVRADYVDVQFDDDATAPDFEQTEFLAGYTSQGSRNSILAEAGYSRLETDFDSEESPTFRLQFSRVLTAALTGTLRAGQEFSDSARDLRSQGNLNIDPNGQETSGQAYEDQYVGAGLDFAKNRTSLRFGIDYRQQDYVAITGLDRDRLVFDARFARQLSRALSANLDARLESVDYTDAGGVDYDETRFGAGLSWQTTPSIALSLAYDHYRRPSSSFDTFDENRVWLRGEWSPGRR